MPDVVELSIATLKDLREWKSGERLFEQLISLDARLTPQVFDAGGPEAPFETVGSAKSLWGISEEIGGIPTQRSMSWRRLEAPASSGGIHFPQQSVRGNWRHGTIYFAADYAVDIKWEEFFSWCLEEYRPIAAILHVLGEDELTAHPDVEQPYSRFYRPVGGGILRGQLPNLGWGTFFGARFAKEINFIGLREDGYLVDALPSGFLVRYSDRLSDVISDFKRFSVWRANLKARFRPDLFAIKWEPGDPRADLDD